MSGEISIPALRAGMLISPDFWRSFSPARSGRFFGSDMQITTTFKPDSRGAWRAWLEQHHGTASEVWLLFDDRPNVPIVAYLDAVEEALCFGWIDSTQKRFSAFERAQRFSPRKKRSNWTELNKERARRLIRLGLMTEAGRATLPDLDISSVVPDDIAQALKSEPGAWANFMAFPELYRQVRVGFIEEQRKDRAEFARRLGNFVKKSAANQMFGNWNDGGRLPGHGNSEQIMRPE